MTLPQDKIKDIENIVIIDDIIRKTDSYSLPKKTWNDAVCVYTDYESDHTGDYTYIIGEEVDSFEDCPSDFVTHTIPAQDYVKFTNGPAAMPEVVREPWFKIWQMDENDLGGKRLYKADFEVYDERAADHQNIVLT